VALDALLHAVACPRRWPWLVIAYPLEVSGFRQLSAACGKARRPLTIVNLDTPLATTLRGRGGRTPSSVERKRIRTMRSEGYHRKPFATATLHNAYSPVKRTARRILWLTLRSPKSRQQRF
jgi:hypothetical protein